MTDTCQRDTSANNSRYFQDAGTHKWPCNYGCLTLKSFLFRAKPVELTLPSSVDGFLQFCSGRELRDFLCSNLQRRTGLRISSRPRLSRADRESAESNQRHLAASLQRCHVTPSIAEFNALPAWTFEILASFAILSINSPLFMFVPFLLVFLLEFFDDCTAGLYISARGHVNFCFAALKLTSGAGLQKWRT